MLAKGVFESHDGVYPSGKFGRQFSREYRLYTYSVYYIRIAFRIIFTTNRCNAILYTRHTVV